MTNTSKSSPTPPGGNGGILGRIVYDETDRPLMDIYSYSGLKKTAGDFITAIYKFMETLLEETESLEERAIIVFKLKDIDVYQIVFVSEFKLRVIDYVESRHIQRHIHIQIGDDARVFIERGKILLKYKDFTIDIDNEELKEFSSEILSNVERFIERVRKEALKNLVSKWIGEEAVEVRSSEVENLQ